MMGNRFRCITAILLVLGLAGAVAPAAQVNGPRLIVVIAVDQMRGDYVEKYQHQWSAGLKRLVTEGAWYRQADYPYFNTVTCAGHASLSTGTVPAVHGMVLNEWWEAASGRIVSCTDDPSQQLISYGRPIAGAGNSAAKLMAPALADELRLQRSPAPRVVSISMKARSAINMGGHRPDVVTWLDDSGAWVTSTAFATAPVPFVAEFVRAHPIVKDIGRVWDRAMLKEKYEGDDSTLGRRNPKVGSLSFPHTLRSAGADVDEAFSDAWESTPFADAYVARMAAAAVDALKLGQSAGVDYLALSFAALDKVGHDFGPESHEVQDVLYRLDRELGVLLDKLDRAVGHGNYTVALSADHGVSPTPERVSAMGFDAGRISVKKLRAALDEVLQRELGPGTYVATVQHTDIYFRPGVYQRLVDTPRAMNAALDVVRGTPGVWRAYRREDLLLGAGDGDPIMRAAARSYFDGRSGDMVLLPRAYWITSESTTTHGTGHRYDTRVPLILFGHGIRAGEYLQPVSPLDIAPTLAFLTSVTLADSTGRVLTEALAYVREGKGQMSKVKSLNP
jgi:predicted AlkP superfamily pyrophosphatase or phosphodiesterase